MEVDVLQLFAEASSEMHPHEFAHTFPATWTHPSKMRAYPFLFHASLLSLI